jgi:hypothetical protein
LRLQVSIRDAMTAQFCAPASFAVRCDGADGAFDGVVIEFYAAVVQEQDQPIPVFGDVFQGLSVPNLRMTPCACR